MELKRYAAQWLFTCALGEVRPIENGGVGIDAQGVVREIFTLSEGERAGVTFLQGALAPGFVNAHTHMELSFFDGVFLPGGSMTAFLRQINDLRIDIDAEAIDRAMRAGYASMEAEGQVGYADISNQADTVAYKASEPFESVSFVEMFGANAPLADAAYAEGLRVLSQYHNGGVKRAYLTPHASYSVSHELWHYLLPHLEQAPIFSFHFAETFQEVEFMETGQGAMRTLYERDWKRKVNLPTMEELLTILGRLGADGKRMLLVHCAALSHDYLKRLKEGCPGASLVLCPASNLFIGGAMPPVAMFAQSGVNLAIGTDSLSSSPTLSMLDQLRLIQRYYPSIPLHRLLSWATRGGATACGFDDLGTIREGVAPGINHLEGSGLLSRGDLTGCVSRPLSNRHRLLAME